MCEEWCKKKNFSIWKTVDHILYHPSRREKILLIKFKLRPKWCNRTAHVIREINFKVLLISCGCFFLNLDSLFLGKNLPVPIKIQTVQIRIFQKNKKYRKSISFIRCVSECYSGIPLFWINSFISARFRIQKIVIQDVRNRIFQKLKINGNQFFSN